MLLCWVWRAVGRCRGILGVFEPLASRARPEVAYRTLFGFMGVVLLVALSIYGRSTDVRPSDEVTARVG